MKKIYTNLIKDILLIGVLPFTLITIVYLWGMLTQSFSLSVPFWAQIILGFSMSWAAITGITLSIIDIKKHRQKNPPVTTEVTKNEYAKEKNKQ
jgi:hypothetical protein